MTFTWHKLQRLQNKALKVICNIPFSSSSKSLYSNLNILTVHNIYKHELAKFVFNCIKIRNPLPFHDYFQKTLQVSSRLTRQTDDKDNLYIPRYRSNRLQRCIKYQGVKIWNAIPPKIKRSSFNSFKLQYKRHLISQY